MSKIKEVISITIDIDVIKHLKEYDTIAVKDEIYPIINIENTSMILSFTTEKYIVLLNKKYINSFIDESKDLNKLKSICKYEDYLTMYGNDISSSIMNSILKEMNLKTNKDRYFMEFFDYIWDYAHI